MNNFLNSNTLVQTATDASFFAIMAVGATIVIISGGIDLSVGSIYALAGVTHGARAARAWGRWADVATAFVGLAVCVAVGLVCGVLNGVLVVGLRVHPFVITLGTMWIAARHRVRDRRRRRASSCPPSLTAVAKASLGLGGGLYPVPMLVMIVLSDRRRDLPRRAR